MRLTLLFLSDIDWEDMRYCLSRTLPRPSTAQLNRVDWIGYPLLVRPGEEEGSWAMVYGYSLAWGAKSMGLAEVPALCLEGSDLESGRCLQISYQHRCQFGEASLLEKSALVGRLLRLAGYSEKEVIDTWLKALMLSPNRATLDRLKCLAAWPLFLTEAAEVADLAPLVLLALAELSLPEVEVLIPFFKNYRWTHSRQREILRLLLDLSRLEEKSLRQICQECRLEETQPPEEAARPQQAERVRRFLFGRRYPRLRQVEENYRECRHALHLPPQIQLMEPAYFEGESYHLRFSFRNREEFERALAFINDLPKRQVFEKLFDFL